jgi:ankyrin repeat protein
MLNIPRWLFCTALVACGITAAGARSLTDSELATLRAWRDGVTQSQNAASLAAQLGQENNLDAIPALLEIKSSIAMNRFVNALRLPSRDIDTPAWEALALQVIKDPAFDHDDEAWSTRTQFLGLIRNYHSPELFEVYYDAAKRRLVDLRRYPGQMLSQRYFWTDLITLLPPQMPVIENIDERIAALVPLADRPCDGLVLIRFLRRRAYAAAFPRMREMYLRLSNTYGDCNADLTRDFAGFHSAAASQAMAQRIRWLVDQPPSPPRDGEIRVTLAVLGEQPKEAQVDWVALEHDVMSKPESPAFMAQLRTLFDAAHTNLARIQTMAPNDLAEWTVQGREDLLRSSIERGADVNAVSTSREKFYGGMTLLNIALAYGQWEVARLLVTSDADVNKPNSNTVAERPLHTISETKFPINEKPARNRVDMVSLLLSHGAQADARDSMGRAPLHFAAQTENAAILATLIAAGAAVDTRDRSGSAAIHYAAQTGNVQILTDLIAAGAEVDARKLPETRSGGPAFAYTDPSDRETPLHMAVTQGKVDAAVCLLDHRADINARTALGITPVMMAVSAKNKAMVRLLIERGADLKVAAPGGQTAILIAHQNGEAEIEAMLRSHGR